MNLTVLAGGVGAARFLRGLVRTVPPAAVTVVGNTGDDAVLHGLHVSPDLDIVTYTLAGLVDEPRGWGVAGDTTRALEQMRALGVDAWFLLGDRDLGTHLARTTWLAEGAPLSIVTDRIRRALGVAVRILPMSDEPVRTRIVTAAGAVRDFQEWFVRGRHEEEVAEVRFEGAALAPPAPGVLDALREADLVLLAPSNPVLSIGPILALAGIRQALRARRSSVVAISPIVEGAALRGPAARLLPVVGAEPSASGVAGLYSDVCGWFVVDRRDEAEARKVESLGMRPVLLDTIMTGADAAAALAGGILQAVRLDARTAVGVDARGPAERGP